MSDMEIHTRQYVSVLTPELRNQLVFMRVRYALQESGCIAYEGDHGPDLWRGNKSNEKLPPRLPVTRNRVYTGLGQAGTYNHQAQLAKFRGKIYYAFSNGVRDEFGPGQRTMLASSEDGKNWGDAVCVAPGDAKSGMFHETSGLYANDDIMVLYVMTKYRTDGKAPHTTKMLRYFEPGVRVDAYSSQDGENWSIHEGLLEADDVWMFEAPRLTQAGTLLVSGSIDGLPNVYRWKTDNPTVTPEIVSMPNPGSEASLFDGEGSWYQTDAGRIIMFWRDGGHSERLYVSWSDDDGESWTQPVVSDFPDSESRVYAGRLPDGRFYIVGNAYAKLFDRSKLMIAISDDGIKFNKIYRLIDYPTAQRAVGLLKCNGYQYPCCLIDGDKLLVGYSVNKEDMEIIEVNIADL